MEAGQRRSRRCGGAPLRDLVGSVVGLAPRVHDEGVVDAVAPAGEEPVAYAGAGTPQASAGARDRPLARGGDGDMRAHGRGRGAGREGDLGGCLPDTENGVGSGCLDLVCQGDEAWKVLCAANHFVS